MLGQYQKKLWKNWPVEETMIMAEDLNRYEDTLEEHDEAIASNIQTLEEHASALDALSTIPNRTSQNESAISVLNNFMNNINYAEDMNAMAANNAIVTDQEKVVGSINGFNIYQRGYVRYLGTGSASGVEYFSPCTSSGVTGAIMDVKAFVHENGHSFVNTDITTTTSNGTVSVSYNPVYDLTVNYSGFTADTDKTMFVCVRYIKLKNVDITYTGTCLSRDNNDDHVVLAVLTNSASMSFHDGDVYKLTATQDITKGNYTYKFKVVNYLENEFYIADIHWLDDEPIRAGDIIYIWATGRDGGPAAHLYKNLRNLIK